MSNSTKDDYAKEVADLLISQIKTGTAPWQKPWKGGDNFLPFNPLSEKKYNGSNALYLLAKQSAHGYDDSRWLTYKQAQSLGAQVRKGEKGTICRFWQWQEERNLVDSNGQAITDKDGKPVKEKVDLKSPRVRAFVLFNGDQIEGMPAPANLPSLPAWEVNQRAEKLLENSNAKIINKPSSRAYYSPNRDEIVLPERGQFTNEGDYYGTALHELSHWTGHKDRMNRDFIGHPFGSREYAKEELRAEITSMMLSGVLQIPHNTENHAAYAASWIQVLEENPAEILKAAKEASGMTKYVLQFDPLQQEQQQEQALENEINEMISIAEDQNACLASLIWQTDNILGKPGWTVSETKKKSLVAIWEQENISEQFIQIMTKNAQKSGNWLSEIAEQLNLTEEAQNQMRLFSQSLHSNDNESSKQIGVLFSQENAEFASLIWDNVKHDDEKPGWYIHNDNRQNELTIAKQDTPAWHTVIDTLAIDAIKQSQRPPKLNMETASENIFISVPFSEREDAKALGAKWDGKEKSWYIPKNSEIVPFSQWLKQEHVTQSREENTMLHVDYNERSEAKALGAKWNKDAKSWIVPAGQDLTPFKKWLTNTRDTVSTNIDAANEFKDVLTAAGFEMKGLPVMDGNRHQVRLLGDKGKENRAAYRFFENTGRPAGWYMNYKTGEKNNWKSNTVARLTDDERKQISVRIEKQQKQQAVERKEKQEQAASAAVLLLETATVAEAEHPYLVKKQIAPFNILQATAKTEELSKQIYGQYSHIEAGDLLLPIKKNTGETRSLQSIKSTGEKRLLPSGEWEGCFAMIGKSNPEKPMWIAEGYATAASVHQATGEPIAIAFSSTNLGNVTSAIREKCPDYTLYIAADNDRHLPLRQPPQENVGLSKAEEAAKENNAIVILPTFGSELDGIDWNDIAVKEGLSGLTRELSEAIGAAQQKEDFHKKEAHQNTESLAEKSEKTENEIEQAVKAFRDLRGSAGIAADIHQAEVSHKQELEPKGKKLTQRKRVGR